MDYRKIYKQLCDRGQLRVREEGVFYERHHILPHSFGGRKTKVNLTTLTLREHYIAHLLLVAIYPDSPAMHTALWNMSNITPKNSIGYERFKPCARTFERIRTEYRKVCSGKNASMYGMRHSEETRKMQSEYRKANPSVRENYSHTEQTKEKLRKKAQGRKATEHSLMRNRQANRGGKCYKAKKVICTLTGQEFGSSRELSEYLNTSMSSTIRWLNGGGNAPSWFHYRRVEEDKRTFVVKEDKNSPIFLEELRGALMNKVDKRDICKLYKISKNRLTQITEKHFPEYMKKRGKYNINKERKNLKED